MSDSTLIIKDYDSSGHNYGTNNEYKLSSFFAIFLSLTMLSILLGNAVVYYWKLHCLQEAGVTMIIGLVIGIIISFHSEETTASLLHFDPTIFFVALLPPIIFNSGYSMKRRFFFQNFASILTFAIVGTLISTMVVGVGLFVLGDVGLSLKLSFAECLTFGSLISATDPVSTLAVFQELHVDPLLFYLVFGESVLNDAVSIVLFSTFSKFIGYTHTVETLLIAILDFVLIFVGSTAIGIFIGCLSALLFKYFNFRGQLFHELSVLFMFSYLPFLISEAAEMSGIVSLLFAAVTMKHYTHNNLTQEAQQASVKIFHLIAYLMETAVFLNLGLSLFGKKLGFDIKLIGWSILVCLLGRALHVYPLSAILNCRREQRISCNQQHMLWFSGLRGAIAFALSLSFPGNHSKEIVSTTMTIVMLSVFVMGGGTIKMLKFLRINRLSPDEERELDLQTRPANTVPILRFDAKYLMPFFTHAHPNIITIQEQELAKEISEQIEIASSNLGSAKSNSSVEVPAPL